MKTVFVDVDTQLDFMVPAGALYVPGAERMVASISRLNHFASAYRCPLISTMDAHRENDEEFHHWPHHCVVGTLGQRKPAETLLSSTPAVVPFHKQRIALGDASQIIVEKRVLDVFRNPNFDDLLRELAADRFVLYGVVTEICVGCAADGLLNTGKRVVLVQDAVKGVKQEDADAMIANFTSRGGTLATVAEVCGA